MKRLHSADTRAGWDREMVRNLGFIKKHLRYPVNRFTILPVLVLCMILPAMCLLMYLIVYGRHAGDKSPWPPLIGIGGVMLAGITGARRFWQTLHFIAIPSPYFNNDNQLILQRFLQSQHFAFSRHPEAPEVFQIMSRSINALKDEREIVVFIADDRRILINSHFTQTRGNLSMGIPHHRQMAGMLKAWMDAGGSVPGTGLRPSSF